MKTSLIRQKFLDYFVAHDHKLVASSALVPQDDPTLLFTNAGMVPFKDVFLGNETRSYQRACSVQRCVRAGGKHNDLENVGYTARHHTFFEMLGNFSFGDYFKSEAIQYAWDFLTQVLGLPAERLWITVHHSDDESADIWLKDIKINPRQLSRCGDKDNYWSMGDTGPCGPCTEIFYDHGPTVAGGPPGTAEEDGDRYVEIWNIVFMQDERHADGSLTPLPKPSVDTGMGLERVAAILQGVQSNYDIDLFQNIITAIKELLKSHHIKVPLDKVSHVSFNVIADHIRSTAFLIADGVVPSNEGRGYVLRRIIRRAVRHGQKLGFKKAFFYSLVEPLIQEMSMAYPDLVKQQAVVKKTLEQEEHQFAKTLAQGLSLLETSLADLKTPQLPGVLVFKLYDTYGFPADLTADIARERGVTLDMAGFDQCMQQQRQRSQQASQFEVAYQSFAKLNLTQEFVGYDKLNIATEVTAVMKNNEIVTRITSGEEALVILATTPFYAESGGQVGDQGRLSFKGGEAQVSNTTKEGQLHVHHIKVIRGALEQNTLVTATVDAERRQALCLNHSATHLLHAALVSILGEHVQQKGSLVTPDRLRFDFSHPEAVTALQLQILENSINEQIRANHSVDTAEMSKEEAIASGATALFNEKYGERIRVLSIGAFSREICGGTHVKRSGDIGLFKILSETGIAAGIRRIEACTGGIAIESMQNAVQQLQEYANLLHTDPAQSKQKLEQLLLKCRMLAKENEQFKAQLATNKSAELLNLVEDVAGTKLLVAQCDGLNKSSLRNLLDDLKQRLQTAVIVLAVVDVDRVLMIAGVTKDRQEQVNANDLIKMLAKQVNGKGGGRADMAQAGGDNVTALPQALQSVKTWVLERVS